MSRGNGKSLYDFCLNLQVFEFVSSTLKEYQ